MRMRIGRGRDIQEQQSSWPAVLLRLRGRKRDARQITFHSNATARRLKGNRLRYPIAPKCMSSLFFLERDEVSRFHEFLGLRRTYSLAAILLPFLPSLLFLREGWNILSILQLCEMTALAVLILADRCLIDYFLGEKMAAVVAFCTDITG
ncbi:hypothetical protein NDU88_004392, partial [Pleurodeles waltl]